MVVINKAIGYFDGASRGNPGEAGAGALIKDKEGNVLWECAKYLGIKTNNEAEYNAVIELLKAVKDLGITEIKIYGDSNLVVSQLSRKWAIKKSHLRELAETAWKVGAESQAKITYVWVPREQNREADKLSNEAIDKAPQNQRDNELEEEAERMYAEAVYGDPER